MDATDSKDIFAQSSAPSAMSRGCNVKVAKGQRSRYAYTAQAVTRTQFRWRTTVVLMTGSTSSEAMLNPDAYSYNSCSIWTAFRVNTLYSRKLCREQHG